MSRADITVDLTLDHWQFADACHRAALSTQQLRQAWDRRRRRLHRRQVAARQVQLQLARRDRRRARNRRRRG